MEVLQYPDVPTVDQVDDYHGTPIADPYRWLEDANSPETKAWIESQNQLTQSFLEDIPSKEHLRKRLTNLWDYPRALAPQKVGGKYFQLRNSGLQNQDVLYWMDSLDGERRVLLDPNEFSEDGTDALTNWEVSKDGNLLAYATNASGSDWQIWRVRDVISGKDLPDELYNLDILDGSPPCSSFSMAGNREKDWGKEKKFREGQAEQILDNLFFDFIDLAKELQPKVVIAENVKGILLGEAVQYVRRIYDAFRDAGYSLKIKPYLLDASKMGVPQKRERVFFVALRNDLAEPFMEQIDMFQRAPKLKLNFNGKKVCS